MIATILPKPTDKLSGSERCEVASVLKPGPDDRRPGGVVLVDGRFIPQSRVGNFDEL